MWDVQYILEICPKHQKQKTTKNHKKPTTKKGEPMNKQNQRELNVLSRLRGNSRTSLTLLSRATHVPISTLHEFIKKKSDWKYTVLPKFEDWGYCTKAHLYLKVKKEEKEQARFHLISHPNVNSLYKVNNGFDFLCEVIFTNLNELESFLENIDERYTVKAKQVNHIMADLKREEFLTKTDALLAMRTGMQAS